MPRNPHDNDRRNPPYTTPNAHPGMTTDRILATISRNQRARSGKMSLMEFFLEGEGLYGRRSTDISSSSLMSPPDDTRHSRTNTRTPTPPIPPVEVTRSGVEAINHSMIPDPVNDPPRLVLPDNVLSASDLPETDLNQSATEQGEVQVALAPVAIPAALGVLTAAVAVGIITQQRRNELEAGLNNGSEEAHRILSDLWATINSELNTRTDIADPVESREEFPAHQPDPTDGTFESPPAEQLPSTPPSQQQTIDTNSQPFPDQSGEFDDFMIVIEEIDPVNIREAGKLLDDTRNKLETLSPDRQRMIEKHVLSEGILNGKSEGAGIHIVVDRNQYGLISDFQSLVSDFVGKPYDAIDVTQIDTPNGPVTYWQSPDKTEKIIMRRSPKLGPTMEFQIKRKPGDEAIFRVKRRYKEF